MPNTSWWTKNHRRIPV